jgi:hypothetical protein
VSGSDGEGKGVRVLSVCPTLAAEGSITSWVGKQQERRQLACCCYCPAANHMLFISSRKQSCARPACPEGCAVLFCAGVILCTGHMCRGCMRQRRNCHVVVVAVLSGLLCCRRLFVITDGPAVHFAGMPYFEYLILNTTPRIPSSRLHIRIRNDQVDLNVRRHGSGMRPMPCEIYQHILSQD